MSSEPVTNVLVVEDEMVLRMRAVDIVEDAGFTALEATNADEALAILESRSDISLLFSDIQMPGSMDGLKLAHAVHDRWPTIKIILVSGLVNVTDADKPADSRFYGKPLAVQQMIAELQAMVGTGARSTDAGELGELKPHWYDPWGNRSLRCPRGKPRLDYRYRYRDHVRCRHRTRNDAE
jgi:CheY-like chemotaxis protein